MLEHSPAESSLGRIISTAKLLARPADGPILMPVQNLTFIANKFVEHCIDKLSMTTITSAIAAAKSGERCHDLPTAAFLEWRAALMTSPRVNIPIRWPFSFTTGRRLTLRSNRMRAAASTLVFGLTTSGSEVITSDTLQYQ